MTELYDFQKVGVQKMVEHGGRVLLADEPGLGKTLQILTYYQNHCNIEKPCVVVCPAYLKENWKREVLRHTSLTPIVLEKRTPPKNFARRQQNKKGVVYIINYEIIGGVKEKKSTWTKELIKLNPILVAADEGHYIKSRQSKRTRNFYELAKEAPKVIIATGTPVTGRPVELFPIVNILWPDKFRSWLNYARTFCNPKWTPWGWDYRGASNLDLLHRMLNKCGMIRRLTKEVLKDLPPLQRQIIPVVLGSEEMKEYKEAEKDTVIWLRKTQPNRMQSSRKAERLTRFGYLRRLAGRLKVPICKNWIENFLEGTEEKLVVFGIHRENVVLRLHEMFKEKSVVVHGAIKGEKRQKAFDAFNNRKSKIKIFFGNIQAAGTGWSCRTSSTVMFTEIAWNPSDHAQAEKRVSGINRGVANQISKSYYLVAVNTIEELIIKINQEKQKTSDQIVDGSFGTNDLDKIYDMLEMELLNNKCK